MAMKIHGNFLGEVRVNFLALFASKLGGAPSTVKHFRSDRFGTSPETLVGNALRANSEFPGFVRLESPQTLENRADSLGRLISELRLPPERLVPFHCFGRGPSMEQPDPVRKFLTVLGAPLSFPTLS